MSTRMRKFRQSLLTVACAIVLTAATLTVAPAARSQDATPAARFVSAMTADEVVALITSADGVLRFEMSEDFTRFVPSDAPVFDDGSPAPGNAFITHGYLYPAGTVTNGTGVLADGSPEFPDKVIGEWACRGWFVADGAHTTSGPILISTQTYTFGGAWGDATLASEGYELPEVGVVIERAVIGGTGPYANARGEVRQTLMGGNAIGGVNVGFEIVLAGV